VREGIRSAVAAVTFLTVLPLVRGDEIRQRDLEAGALLFPIVGALAGAFVATTAWAASLVLPASAAGVVGVATGVLITAALHLDGLADVADGIGASLSGGDPAPAMRDPRLGVFGGTALVLDLALKITIVAGLVAGGTFPAEAIAAGAVARLAPLALASVLPYAGSRHAWTSRIGVWTCLGAAVLATIVGIPAAGLAFAAMVAVSSLATVVIGRWAAAHLGGTTGDVFGAVAEVSETLGLAVALAFR
jgi:adenosylcobinamide-GDP ribazoletransferase